MADHYIVEATRLDVDSAGVSGREGSTPTRGSDPMVALNHSTLTAYERWAPVYPPVAHNPLMRAEQRAMLEVWPDMDGRRVLDLACGSGRYSHLLREANAAQVVAVDFCAAMLEQVDGRRPGPREHDAAAVPVGGVRRGRFRPGGGSCDGHSAVDVRGRKSAAPGGNLVYSDFHSEAIRAGMTRSFKDAADVTWTVPHQVYDLSRQQDAMAAAGLTVETVKRGADGDGAE